MYRYVPRAIDGEHKSRVVRYELSQPRSYHLACWSFSCESFFISLVQPCLERAAHKRS